MLNGVRLVKLVVQNESGELIFFREEKKEAWSLLFRKIKPGEFPEQTVTRLVKNEFSSEMDNLRLLKVLETDDEQIHLFLYKIDKYQGKRKIKIISAIEARDLKLGESDKMAVEHFESVFYRAWGE